MSKTFVRSAEPTPSVEPEPTPTPTNPIPEPPKPVSAKTGMRTASCRCILSKGWDVPLYNVTPAEALLLTAEHQRNAAGKPLFNLVEGERVDRAASLEIQRLTQKYGAFKVKALFTGAIPTLPESFEEAIEVGMRTAAPRNNLGSFQL